MAEALQPYIEDPELRSRHAAQSRRRAVSEFSMQHMVDCYAGLYREAMAA